MKKLAKWFLNRRIQKIKEKIASFESAQVQLSRNLDTLNTFYMADVNRLESYAKTLGGLRCRLAYLEGKQ